MLTGLPKTVILSSEEVRHALEEPIGQIIDAIQLDARQDAARARRPTSWIAASCSPAAERCSQGLDQRLRQETHMPTHLAESPLTCVAVGSGRSLEEFDAMRNSARARARSRSRNGRGRY